MAEFYCLVQHIVFSDILDAETKISIITEIIEQCRDSGEFSDGEGDE